MNKKAVIDSLLDYGLKHSTEKREDIFFTPNNEANKLILSDYNAFFFAVLLDERIKAERAWEGPYLLKQRIGHLDTKLIAKMEESELALICAIKPVIHFEYNKTAKRIKEASILLNTKYDSKAENIWKDNPRTDDLQRRFEEFNGVAQKKSSMAVNILVRDLGIPCREKQWIDVSDDAHVRRVFQRTGLLVNYSQKALLETARELHPEYPGALDLPCWLIGRRFCRPTEPECSSCPLDSYCPKLMTT
jgi:uncharacterized HhH-GPD family protein